MIYKILKWYSIVVLTLSTAMSFVYWANGDNVAFIIFLGNLPIAVYLWSLVARRKD